MPAHNIIRTLNRISFSGRLNAEAIPVLIGALRQAETAGFQDIVLDFSQCTRAFTNGTVPLAAMADKYRLEGFDFELILPSEASIARLFENTGLANIIAPIHFNPTSFQSSRHVPIQRFRSHMDQFALGRAFMDVILKATRLNRDVLQGLEWSLNEIMDNVPNHAKSQCGGFACLTSLPNSVSFTVADSGVGILETLREGYPSLANDTEALGEAIKAGVTRNTQAGQGNGLAGTLRIATDSGGSFSIMSGRGRLNVFRDPRTSQLVAKRKVYEPAQRYAGTIVDVQISKNPDFKVLEALGFTGMIGGLFDVIEAQYESETGDFMMKLAAETTGFGTREAGRQIRTKCLNILEADTSRPLVLDWSGVPVVSSSFADEALGKLFVELGPIGFSARVKNIGLEPLVRGLLEKAILQRASEASKQFTDANQALENIKESDEPENPESI